MFLLGFLTGTVVIGILFIIFYKSNLKTLSKVRSALIEVYERVGGQVEDIVSGVDKKVDKEIRERKS